MWYFYSFKKNYDICIQILKIWADLLTKTSFYFTISPEVHAEQTVVGYNDQSISGKGGMRIKFY